MARCSGILEEHASQLLGTKRKALRPAQEVLQGEARRDARVMSSNGHQGQRSKAGSFTSTNHAAAGNVAWAKRPARTSLGSLLGSTVA